MLNTIYNGRKNKHKTIIISIFIGVFFICLILSYYALNSQHISHNKIIKFIEHFTSSIITFISICFGFYLTSLSILFSSKYIKTLNVEDVQKPTQRKIHTIKEYFKLAIYCSLLTIILSLLVLLLFSIFQNKYILSITFSVFIAIFIENFIIIYWLLKIFMNAIVIQARPD